MLCQSQLCDSFIYISTFFPRVLSETFLCDVINMPLCAALRGSPLPDPDHMLLV